MILRQYTVCVHEDLEQDLDLLYEADPDCANDIAVLLEEISTSELWAKNLDRFSDGKEQMELFPVKHDTSPIWQFFNRGKNLYRLKFLDIECIEPQRVLFAFKPDTLTFHFLAVMPRSVNYSQNHPLIQRVLNRYDDLGIQVW